MAEISERASEKRRTSCLASRDEAPGVPTRWWSAVYMCRLVLSVAVNNCIIFNGTHDEPRRRAIAGRGALFRARSRSLALAAASRAPSDLGLGCRARTWPWGMTTPCGKAEAWRFWLAPRAPGLVQGWSVAGRLCSASETPRHLFRARPRLATRDSHRPPCVG